MSQPDESSDSRSAPTANSVAPHIAYQTYTLSNGLEAILHENHATPLTCVNIWYHVGSKNERPGRTGFAHLFEHLMFQGSKHWDNDFFAPLQEAGGTLNGSTNTDRTNYWEVVPSNFLERALWLEADRMGFLIDAMTQEKLDNQRDVVKNERRQNYEDRPYGSARGILAEAAYPPGHPYSWLTIGSHEDLTAATLDDVKDFYRQFYNPSNATLVVAGDIDEAATRDLIEKHFGGLPPGPPVWRCERWVPRLDGERRLTAQDRVQLPRLYVTWHTPPFFSTDDAALDILGQILGGGKSSRLYEHLVYERQIAQDVSAVQLSREIAGSFEVMITARRGHTTTELQAAVDDEIDRMSKDGPGANELQRVKNRIESGFIRGLERVGGFNGVADQLNLYNHYVGDPGYFADDLARWSAVTVDDVKRVARHYLTGDRVVLSVQPMAALLASASPLSASVVRTEKPAELPSPSIKLPRPQRRRLPNGLELVVLEHRHLPVLELNLVVHSGSGDEPHDSFGIADMTATLLDEGTAKRSALDIARELDGLGAQLSLFAGRDTSGATLSVLVRHAEAALNVVGDLLTGPTFPPEEIERGRKARITRILQQKDRPDEIARRAIARILYGADHPYGHESLGDEQSVSAIQRDQVEAFYRRHWRPHNSTLIVAGGISIDEAEQLVRTALGDWTGIAETMTRSAVAERATGRVTYLVDKPGAAQSVINIGQLVCARNTPDFFPLQVMNTALGGMFSSRLNLNLREDKGYTYGARTYFNFRKLIGSFIATASVQTRVTRESIIEFFAELDGVRGSRPLEAKELEFAKSAIVRGFPRRFETPGEIAAEIREVVTHSLADDYFDRYVGNVEGVSLDDCSRAAKEHVHPDDAAIVVVGDAGVIRHDLEKLGYGPVVDLDSDGRPT